MASGLWSIKDKFFAVKQVKDEATMRAEAAEGQVAVLEAEVAEVKTKMEGMVEVSEVEAAKAEAGELKAKVGGG